jgi:hypothetical protein
MSVESSLWIVLILALIGIVFLVLYLRKVRERARRIEQDILARCGAEPGLLSRCTVIHKANRVPGRVALCHDRLIFRSLILNISGEIPLGQIERVEVKRALQDRYAYKKVVAGARVLEIFSTGGDVQRFFLKTSEIATWEQALKK